MVNNSARHFVEYQQMEQRLRLDLPTLADPVVRDLLQESDLFSRSFNGMGGFGLLSPLEFVQIVSLAIEVASHIWIIFTLMAGATHFSALLFSLASAILPLLAAWVSFPQGQTETTYSPQEVHASERQEWLRNLAFNETHRSEIILFGLRPWILQSWSKARKVVINSEDTRNSEHSKYSILVHLRISDFVFALRNVGPSELFGVLIQ